MKRIIYFICILSITVLVSSCGGLLKYYTLPTTEEMDSFIEKSKMVKINLDDYDFYKREYYFRITGDSLIKGYENTKVNTGNIRYEMQFFLIERANKDQKSVIYFNMIPPYKYGGKWLYSYELYDNESIFNINQINYVQFGTLNRDHEVKFIKEKSVSIWDITRDENYIDIDHVLFLDGNKLVDIDPSLKLQHKPIYKHIKEPEIMLHYYIKRKISTDSTDYLKEVDGKKHILYYNTANNTINFQFSAPLRQEDNTKNEKTWVSFPASRVRGKLK